MFVTNNPKISEGHMSKNVHMDAQDLLKILLIGIPAKQSLDVITKNHTSCTTIYVTETRPFETDVADAIKEWTDPNIALILLADNMIGSLFQNNTMEAVYLQGQLIQEDCWNTFPGSAVSVLYAQQYSVPTYCIPTEHSGIPVLTFFDFDIKPEGAPTIPFEWDIIPVDHVQLHIDTTPFITENC